MRPVVDPEGVEVSHFISASQPSGKRILEIGCGHGNFTCQYANLPSLVMGVDPLESELQLAKENNVTSDAKVFFTCARGEGLPFASQSFDIVVFASSL